MYVWNGTTWQPVGGGTSTIVFSMTQETTLNNAAATWSIIPWTGSPQVDTMPGAWDSVTKKYTPKKPGYYVFNARVVPTLQSGFSAVALLKNDDGIFDNISADIMLGLNYSSQVGWVTLTCIAQMNGTTDYARAFSFGGGVLNAQGSSPAFSVLRLP
jgi:hypothetical protein